MKTTWVQNTLTEESRGNRCLATGGHANILSETEATYCQPHRCWRSLTGERPRGIPGHWEPVAHDTVPSEFLPGVHLEDPFHSDKSISYKIDLVAPAGQRVQRRSQKKERERVTKDWPPATEAELEWIDRVCNKLLGPALQSEPYHKRCQVPRTMYRKQINKMHDGNEQRIGSSKIQVSAQQETRWKLDPAFASPSQAVLEASRSALSSSLTINGAQSAAPGTPKVRPHSAPAKRPKYTNKPAAFVSPESQRKSAYKQTEFCEFVSSISPDTKQDEGRMQAEAEESNTFFITQAFAFGNPPAEANRNEGTAPVEACFIAQTVPIHRPKRSLVKLPKGCWTPDRSGKQELDMKDGELLIPVTTQAEQFVLDSIGGMSMESPIITKSPCGLSAIHRKQCGSPRTGFDKQKANRDTGPEPSLMRPQSAPMLGRSHLKSPLSSSASTTSTYMPHGAFSPFPAGTIRRSHPTKFSFNLVTESQHRKSSAAQLLRGAEPLASQSPPEESVVHVGAEELKPLPEQADLLAQTLNLETDSARSQGTASHDADSGPKSCGKASHDADSGPKSCGKASLDADIGPRSPDTASLDTDVGPRNHSTAGDDMDTGPRRSRTSDSDVSISQSTVPDARVKNALLKAFQEAAEAADGDLDNFS